MNIVIIEDEQLIADDLWSTLQKIDPDLELQSQLTTIDEAIAFFSEQPQPDLIFSDIQLGDGLSFEIFEEITIDVPIIFCTAFDHYAIEAFSTSGIDYILKPYNIVSISKALQKFQSLKTILAKDILQQYAAIKQTLDNYRLNESVTFVVRYRDRYIPVAFDRIAMFYVENEITQLYLFNGQTYFLTISLEEVEKQLNLSFFRANRQFIVNRTAIYEIAEFFPRKLKLILKFPFRKEIIIAKEKKTKLLQWFNNI